MKDRVFLDTNVLIYLYSYDEIEKQKNAYDSICKNDCITSTQAINEFCNVMTKKWKLGTYDVKKSILEIEKYCQITFVDIEVVNKALYIYDKYRFSYFDSLMISSSLINNCKYILTEDMKDGQIIESTLEVVNIFKV